MLVLFNVKHFALIKFYHPAIESNSFTLKQPESFFSIFSPPRNDAAFKPARDHLEEQLRFSGKMVNTAH